MRRHRYTVVGSASPDLPLRVLNLFAQQALAIDAAHVRRSDGRYEIDVSIADLPDQSATIIAEKLRAMVLVERVELRCDPDIPAAPPTSGPLLEDVQRLS